MDENSLKKMRERAFQEIKNTNSTEELEEARIKYLGRKGELALIFKSLPDLSSEDKRKFGPAVNDLKEAISGLIFEREKSLEKRPSEEFFDITKPGKRLIEGHRHPLAIVEKEAREAFLSMNFSVIDGRETETEHYNFDALNVPSDHPARDTWDTFWLKSTRKENKKQDAKWLMRTHTSPMQVRFMEKNNPPLRIIVPGRVFRYEATDASHEINFYQIEGLVVDYDTTLANLKYVIEAFLTRLFGDDIDFRFRPSYFPFTEPSLEVDIKLNGQWLEIMGAGMVHRNVFKAVGYDPNKVQGFAFGVGLDRLAMIKYKIPDIRLFYSGDLRLTKQF